MFRPIARQFINGLCVLSLIGNCWGISLARAAPADQEEHCTETDATAVSSPDGTWVAKSYGKVCDLGLSSSTTVIVELIRSGSATFRQVILGMEMPSTKSEWPKLAWESADKVLIDLPSNAQIGLQVASFQGVEVNVRFCPRDPAIRTKWLEYRAAYRQWLKDSSAWIEMKRHDSTSTAPNPVRPIPPKTGTTATCAE